MKTLLAALAAVSVRLAEGYKGPADTEWTLARHMASRIKADPEAAKDLARLLQEQKPDEAIKRWSESTDALWIIDDCMRLLGSLRADIVAAQAAATLALGRTAEATKPPPPPAGDTAPNAEDRKAIADLKQQMHETRVAESRTRLSAAADAAKLPAKAKAALLLQHGGRVLESGEETRIVEAQRAVIDDAIAAAGGGVATIVRESADRTRDLLAHAFNPTQVPAPKEGAPVYLHDGLALFERHVFGGVRLQEAVYGGDAGRRRLREAIDSTTSAKTLQDAMEIAVLAAYNGVHGYTGWQKIVRRGTLANFRTHRIVKVPYYGNLPVVEKGAAYQEITTTTETEQTIALVKYGAIESILMEDLLNGDFLDIWQQRIQRLGRAAMETRSEIVHKIHRDATQPTMADSATLTASGRSPANEGTAVMSDTLATAIATVMAAITGMMAATGGSGVAKGIIPRYVVLPKEKIAAYNAVIQGIAGGNAGVDFAAMVKRMGWYIPEPIIDLRTTNTTDHYFFADPNDAEVIRFSELAGRSGPRITIADQLSFGAMFTNDKLEAKIDDVFAAAAVDFAGIYGNDAAS